MITKHEDIYFTNKFHNRFLSEEDALKDEQLRDFCPFKIKTLNNGANISWGGGIVGIDDYGRPFGRQPNNTNTVFLLKDIIEKCNELIKEHGENVGLCHQHHGLGQYAQVLVLLEENDHEFYNYNNYWKDVKELAEKKNN